MMRVLPFAAGCLLLGAMPAAAQYRDEAPERAIDAAQRPDQPMVMAAPARIDPRRGETARFAAAYARSRAPRIVIFWNRELTDDVTTDREEYVTSSGARHATASSNTLNYATRRSGHVDITARADSTTDSETRSGSRRLVPGLRDTPNAEAIDVEIQQGFTDTLSGAGVRLVDRTAILRTGALSGNTANVQAIETRAILGKAELTLEVVPLDDPRMPNAVSYKIFVRNLRTGRILASFSDSGQPPAGAMPYVAGARGFVRATPRGATPRDVGEQLARRVMAALSTRL